MILEFDCTGYHDHPLVRTWYGMRARCYNPKNSTYKYYGGKGIKICDRWYKFFNFVQDMGPRPPGTSIDRKDGSADYSPENCRWSTKREQMNNRANTIRLTWNDETLSLSAWARRVGLSWDTLYQRICVAGWDVGRALTVSAEAELYAFEGKALSLSDWAKEKGVDRGTLYYRIRHGWSLERALSAPARSKSR